MMKKKKADKYSENNDKRKNKKFRLDKQARERIDNEYRGVSENFTNYNTFEPAATDYSDEFYSDEVYEDEKPKHKHKRLKKLIVTVIILCIVVLLANVALLMFSGQIWFNEPKKRDYPVRGPVVNQDLGTIGWTKFSQQNIQMCYIRATKSTTYVDESFEKNWASSSLENLPVGALHIFDLSMDGTDQAQHFCDTTGNMSGRLCPAVEIDLSLFQRVISPDREKVLENLQNFLDYVEDFCGLKPVIKCSSSSYKEYVKGEFDDYPLWYESLYSKPDEDINWTFWEYTSRTKISFYKNSDEYVHMTVYKGKEDDFKNFVI